MILTVGPVVRFSRASGQDPVPSGRTAPRRLPVGPGAALLRPGPCIRPREAARASAHGRAAGLAPPRPWDLRTGPRRSVAWNPEAGRPWASDGAAFEACRAGDLGAPLRGEEARRSLRPEALGAVDPHASLVPSYPGGSDERLPAGRLSVFVTGDDQDAAGLRAVKWQHAVTMLASVENSASTRERRLPRLRRPRPVVILSRHIRVN